VKKRDIEDSPQEAAGNLNARKFIFIFAHLPLQQAAANTLAIHLSNKKGCVSTAFFVCY